MPDTPDITPKSRSSPRRLKIVDLLRPHWKTLTLALLAEAAARRTVGRSLMSLLEHLSCGHTC